jgi:hypothetical protein
MKKILGVFLCLVPMAAYAQQRYTNEDLKKFSVPGAYTNEDLKKMAPVPVVGKPTRAPSAEPVLAPVSDEYVQSLYARMDLLQEQRTIIQAELDWRNAQIEKAYSFFDKGPNGYPGSREGGPYPGYVSKSKGSLQYLEMELAIVDARIEGVQDEARRADVVF